MEHMIASIPTIACIIAITGAAKLTASLCARKRAERQLSRALRFAVCNFGLHC